MSVLFYYSLHLMKRPESLSNVLSSIKVSLSVCWKSKTSLGHFTFLMTNGLFSPSPPQIKNIVDVYASNSATIFFSSIKIGHQVFLFDSSHGYGELFPLNFDYAITMTNNKI